MTYFLGPRGANIIGAGDLTDVFGMGTRVALPLWSPGHGSPALRVGRSLVSGGGPVGQVNRVNRRREAGCMRFGRASEEALPVWRISTAQLNTLRCLHRRPIDLLVLKVP